MPRSLNRRGLTHNGLLARNLLNEVIEPRVRSDVVAALVLSWGPPMS